MLHECEKLAGLSLSAHRKFINDAFFVLPFEKDADLYQFEITAETLMTSNAPLPAVSSYEETELPDMFPLKCNISIPAEHLYQPRNIYREFNSCVAIRNLGCNSFDSLFPYMSTHHQQFQMDHGISSRTQCSCITHKTWSICTANR